jgi:hypothetical protein
VAHLHKVCEVWSQHTFVRSLAGAVRQAVSIRVVIDMLTIAKLSRWSINYYNDTAKAVGQAVKDAQKAGGGLGEYYTD